MDECAQEETKADLRRVRNLINWKAQAVAVGNTGWRRVMKTLICHKFGRGIECRHRCQLSIQYAII